MSTRRHRCTRAALLDRVCDDQLAGSSVEGAIADSGAAFGGAYGPLLTRASLLAERDGTRVAAILTVRQAPWPDTPAGPLVIEFFTNRFHRRRGLARALLVAAGRATRAMGAATLGLRVDPGNLRARSLYDSLRFR